MRYKVLDTHNGNTISARANSLDRIRRDFKGAPAGRYVVVDRETGERTDAATGDTF